MCQLNHFNLVFYWFICRRFSLEFPWRWKSIFISCQSMIIRYTWERVQFERDHFTLTRRRKLVMFDTEHWNNKNWFLSEKFYCHEQKYRSTRRKKRSVENLISFHWHAKKRKSSPSFFFSFIFSLFQIDFIHSIVPTTNLIKNFFRYRFNWTIIHQNFIIVNQSRLHSGNFHSKTIRSFQERFEN